MKNKLPILVEHAYRRLEQGIDHAIKINPKLAIGGEQILRPIKTLNELAKSAPHALNNDVKAIEGMQILLQLTASDTHEIRGVLRDFIEPFLGNEITSTTEYQQELLNIGPLVLLAMAAGRVGQFYNPKFAVHFIDIVESLVVATLPAQALSRAISTGVDYDGLAAILGGFSLKDPHYTRLHAMAPVLLNQCDGYFYQCINRLFKKVSEQISIVKVGNKNFRPREWDGASSHPIEQIENQTSNRINIRLSDDVGEGFIKQVDKIVFASPVHQSGDIITSNAHKDTANPLLLTTSIPTSARAGWLGIQTRTQHKNLLNDRKQLIDFWKKEQSTLPCLNDSKIPFSILVTDNALQPAPRYSQAATWGIRILDINFSPDGNLNSEKEIAMSVILSQPHVADKVIVSLTAHDDSVASSKYALSLDDKKMMATGKIPKILTNNVLMGTVSVYSHSRKQPDDEKEFKETITSATGTIGSATRPDFTPTPTAFHEDTGKVDDVNIIVVRPAFITRDSNDQLVVKRATFDDVPAAVTLVKSANLGLATLPWLSDHELSVDGLVSDIDGAQGTELLERLEKMAALTIGGENSIWVALLPTPDNPPQNTFFRISHSSVARLLILCDTTIHHANLASHLAYKKQQKISKKTKRLRIIGAVKNGEISIHEPTRVETRIANFDATYPTEFIVRSHQDSKTAISATRISTISPASEGSFVTLVPVDDSLHSIQFQRRGGMFEATLTPVTADVSDYSLSHTMSNGDQALAYEVEGKLLHQAKPFSYTPLPIIYHWQGTPTISFKDDVTFGPTTIAWCSGHNRGLPSQIEIELGYQGLWRCAYKATPGASRAKDIDLTRLGPGQRIDALRIVASDGWNTVYTVKDRTELEDSGFELDGQPFLIRHAGKLRYWIDADFQGIQQIQWTLTSESLPSPIVITLPPNGVFVARRQYIGGTISAKAIPLKSTRHKDSVIIRAS